MRGDQVDGDEVLAASTVLRERSAALRTWSSAARAASSAERDRARALRQACAQGARETPRRSAHPRREVALLPALGSIEAEELRVILVRCHGFTEAAAALAVTTGMWIAGYPETSLELGAADAFDVMDHALQEHP